MEEGAQIPITSYLVSEVCVVMNSDREGSSLLLNQSEGMDWGEIVLAGTEAGTE